MKTPFLFAACIFCVLFQLSGSGYTQPIVSGEWNEGSILLGTVYNVFHSEYRTDVEFFEQVDRDIPAMKAANIRQVMIFPMTQWDSKTRKIRWERTDYLIRKIEEQGLKFIPLMLKEEQCSHYFPIWKLRENSRLWEQHYSENGVNSRENVDFADPDVFPMVVSYFQKVVERYGDSPALSFYNIWNEPHYDHHSQHVLNAYLDWLKSKYGTLNELNRSWGEDYFAWDQVSPFVNDDWDSSMPSIDWILFRNAFNGELLGRLRDVLRTFDPHHPVNANPVGTTWSGFGDFGGYNTDNWQFTAHEDICGMSYYPDGWDRSKGLEPHPVWLHNLTFNTVRSAAMGKDYILTEIYTNAKNGLTLGGWLSADELRHLAWLSMANDCKGLVYWKWLPFYRGRQSLGRGLCYVNGDLAPRGEAVKALGAELDKWGKLLYEARLEQPEVAVLLDMNGLLKTLTQPVDPNTRQFMYESNAGLFRLLDSHQLGVDFLRADLGQISLELLHRYQVIILPFQIVMRREIASVLAEYVRLGGCLIADARTATIDEQDFAYKKSPGGGLSEVFGAERIDWVAERTGWWVQGVGEAGDGMRFSGRYFREKLKCAETATPLAVFEDAPSEVAVVKNTWGRGTGYLFATPLGGTLFAEPESSVGHLLMNLIHQEGVKPYANWIGSGQVVIRHHHHPNGELVYLINGPEGTADGRLFLAHGLSADSTCYELTAEHATVLNAERAPDSASLDLQLKPWEVRLFWISSRRPE